jgi:transcriptional regulator with XRE-family HTH domain
MQDVRAYEKAFGARLKAARKNKQLRQVDLAALVYVSPNEVLNWEGGKRMPPLRTVCELAKLLDVTAGWLVAGEGET